MIKNLLAELAEKLVDGNNSIEEVSNNIKTEMYNDIKTNINIVVATANDVSLTKDFFMYLPTGREFNITNLLLTKRGIEPYTHPDELKEDMLRLKKIDETFPFAISEIFINLYKIKVVRDPKEEQDYLQSLIELGLLTDELVSSMIKKDLPKIKIYEAVKISAYNNEASKERLESFDIFS